MDGKTTTGWLNIFESMDGDQPGGRKYWGGLWRKKEEAYPRQQGSGWSAITEAFQLAKNRPGQFLFVQASAVGICGVESDEVLPETPSGVKRLAGWCGKGMGGIHR